MYDHSPKRSWFNVQDLGDIKIKIMFATGTAASALNEGRDSLYNYEAHLPFVEVIGIDSFSIEEELNGFTKFTAVVEKNISTPNDLHVYAACFLDGLNFGNDLFNKFYGPLSAEKVLNAGQINQESGYFYYPETNEEYGGPVHGHQNNWMEGSEHSESPHSSLVYVPEENYKIVLPPAFGQVGSLQPGAFGNLGVNVFGPRGESQSGGAGTDVPEDFEGPPPPNVITELPGAETPGGPQSGAAEDIDIEGPNVNQGAVPDRLQDVNFEVRDAVRRGLY